MQEREGEKDEEGIREIMRIVMKIKRNGRSVD